MSIVVGAKSNPLPTLEQRRSRDAGSRRMNGMPSRCKVIAAMRPHGPAPAIITGRLDENGSGMVTVEFAARSSRSDE